MALEEATGELLHLILPRHIAPPDIGGSRLFSSRPPSKRLTGGCARAVPRRREAGDRCVSVARRLGRICQTKLVFAGHLEGLVAPSFS